MPVRVNVVIAKPAPEATPVPVETTTDVPVETPTVRWTHKQLDAYAETHHITLPAGATKAEKVAALTT